MNRQRTPEQQARLFKKQVFKQPKKWVKIALHHAVVESYYNTPTLQLFLVRFYAGLSLRLISMIKEPKRSELFDRREEAYLE